MKLLRRIFYSGLHYQLGRHPDIGYVVGFASVHLGMPMFFLLLASAHALSRVFPVVEVVLDAERFPVFAGAVFLALHLLFAWTFGSTSQINVHYTEFKKDAQMVNGSTVFAFFPVIISVIVLVASLALF